MTISTQSSPFVIESAGFGSNGAAAQVVALTTNGAPDGRFVVVWQEELGTPANGITDVDGAIFARIYNADGTAAGEAMQINAWYPGVQAAPHVAATDDGGFAVTFQSTMNWGQGPNQQDTDTYFVRFDKAGSPVLSSGFGSAISEDQAYVDLIPDNPGRNEDLGTFLTDMRNGYIGIIGESHSAIVLDRTGAVAGSVTVDELTTAGFSAITSLTRLENGNVLIGGLSTSDTILLRLSDISLTSPPDEIPGLQSPVVFQTGLSSTVSDVTVTALDPGAFAPDPAYSGGFVVSALVPAGGSSQGKLVLETFTPWGTSLGRTTISTGLGVADAGSGYDVLALQDGTFAVAWVARGLNARDVMVGHFDANGTALGPWSVIQSAMVSGDQIAPSLSLLSSTNGSGGTSSRIVVTFTDLAAHAINGVSDTLHAVTLTIGSSSGFVITAGNDTLNGTSAGDGIDGLAGNDLINGKLGNDALFGNDGADSLYGGLGNDALRGGNGLDKLYGGDGADGLDGGALADTLFGDAGRDALFGGLDNDRLNGGTEADRLNGGAGNDTLNGGSGADIFVFRNAGGVDVVADFAADDYLRLDRALWRGEGNLTAAQVLSAHGAVVGGSYVLTFADGERITLQNFTALTAGDLQLI